MPFFERIGGALGGGMRRTAGTIIGFGAGAAAATVFEPPFAELRAQTWRRFPNQRLSPQVLADLAARGLDDVARAQSEAAETGIGPERFQRLLEGVGAPPGFGELLEARRRGTLDDAALRRAARQSRIREEWVEALLTLRRRLLSPAEVAGAVARGFLSEGDGQRIAALSGIEAEDFGLLVQVAGAAPAGAQVLDMLNRGLVSESEATRALQQTGLRPEWIQPVLGLRQVIPQAQDIVRFALREVYTPEVAQQFGQFEGFPTQAMGDASRAGLDEDTMLKFWAAHWALPSVQQGFEMLHRGTIDNQTLERLLRAADVMPFWRDQLLEISFRPFTRVDVRRMFRDGTIDRERVFRSYLDIGYDEERAELLTEWTVRQQVTDERELTKGEVKGLYRERAIPREEAQELLGALGFDPEAIEYMLLLEDFRRGRTLVKAAQGVIRSRYVRREIDSGEASNRLDDLGVAATERDDLIDLWTFQRDETPRRLTPAVLKKAFKEELIDEGEFRVRLAQLGYEAPDVDILVALAAPAAEEA